MNEREYLKDLAKRQLEIANLPVMGERLKKWYALNNAKLYAPLVTVEFNGPQEEFFPPLKCESDNTRDLERQISRIITYHEQLNDDRVIPAYISVGVPNWILPFGLRVKYSHAKHSDGRPSMGYEMHYVIKDLEEDFDKLGASETQIDEGLKKAQAKKTEIEDIVGDILPVKIEFSSFGASLGNIICSLMGMENMFTAMYDYPELFHKMMNRLTDDILRFMDGIEASGAILCNNDGSRLGQGTWGYTDSLPSGADLTRPVTFADVWGYSNFQETVGMSNAMFDEFFFSYMEKITNRFGLLSYGCCEPVDGIWDDCLSRLVNLRKLSVSAWCREEYLAERIRGKKIIYHRKPSANYISVDSVFDGEAFGSHIAKSVKAARGCPLEVTFREELTVRGEPWRLKKAVDITREQFERHYQA